MKKSQKKFQKYFSYQPKQETNPGRIKPPFALFATTPRAHLPEKNLRLLGKRNRISFSLVNLTFLFKKNWHSLGKGSKSSFSLVSLVFRYGARRFDRVRKHGNRKKSKQQLSRPLEYRLVKLGCFGLLTFLVTLIAVSAFAPVQLSSAATSTANLVANISDTNYYLNLSSTGSVLNIGATPGGTLSAAMDTINVKTNNPNGYKLYLSMNTNSNRLYLNGDDTSNKYFSPTSGTFLNPRVLDNNSWGYALAEADAETVRTKLSLTAETNFSETYSTTPADNSTWAAVPAKGSDQLIKYTTGPNEMGVDTNVYYAAKVNVALPSGTYKGTVLYTAIADTGSVVDAASVAPTQVYADTMAEQSITIATSLYANAELIGEVVATVGGVDCPVTAKITNAVNANVEITCTVPKLARGTYDVTVEIPFYEKTYTVSNGLTYVESPYMQDYLW